ncbi:MAG: YdbH domain-containing protein [Rhodospirillales bacterium]|nr:YdbH domain-containing protein [Rhodospirillales bacterium]
MKRAGIVAIGLTLFVFLLFMFSGSFLARLAFHSAINGAGFPNAHYENARFGTSGVTFERVALDTDSFSTIETISATYSLPGLLFRGKIDTLSLKNAVLTGEWRSGPIPAIAGWIPNSQTPSPPSLPEVFPFAALTIENLRLDLDTQEGGITLLANAALSTTADGDAAFQANIEGKQYQLSIKAGLSGKKTADGQWSLEANIENGRVNLESFKFSRIDGWITASGGPGTPEPTLSGQLTAGKLAAGWIQMQSLTASLDGTPDAPHLIVNGAAAGVPGLALAAELRDGALSATLSASGKTDLRDYLTLTAKILNRPPPPMQTIPKGFSALTLRLNREPTPADRPTLRRYSLSLSDAEKTLDAYSDLMWDGNTLAGTIQTGPISLDAAGPLFPTLLPEGWKLVGGTADIQGQIAMAYDTSGLRIDGPMKIKLKDVDLDSAPARIEGAEGSFVFDSLTPPVTTGFQKLAIAQADIGLPIEQITANIKIDPSGVLTVQGASGDFANGRIEAAPFEIHGGSFQGVEVRLSGVDLKRAVKAFRARDISLSGILDGGMTLSGKPGEPVYAQGRIEARAPGGLVRYAPDPVPAFLAGDDPGLETARLALENLAYEALSVDFKGPLGGDMETHLIARGYNSKAFGDRPVELNLNLQGAILPLFQLAR